MLEKGLEALVLIFLGRETCRDVRKKKVSVPAAGMTALTVTGIRLLRTGIAKGLMAVPQELAGLCLGLTPGLFLLLTARVTRGAIGYGDGLVLLACGACLGFWDTAGLLMLALFLAALVSLAILASRRGNRKTELPFLPFLLAAWMLRILALAGN